MRTRRRGVRPAGSTSSAPPPAQASCDQTTYGDWLNVNDNTAQDIVSMAFFAWSARLVSRMAGATGRSAQAVRYGMLADQVAAAFTHRFVHADGTMSGDAQKGNVLAIAFELLPSGLRQPTADRLAAKVAERGGHLFVGFLRVQNLMYERQIAVRCQPARDCCRCGVRDQPADIFREVTRHPRPVNSASQRTDPVVDGQDAGGVG